VPPGCSVQSGGDWAAHFNSGSGNNDGSYSPVCMALARASFIEQPSWVNVQAPAQQQDPGNLIRNPSFDDDSSWTSSCPATFHNGHSDVQGNCLTGNRWMVPAPNEGNAWMIKSGRCYDRSSGGVFQNFPTQPGRTYRVTYKVLDGWFDHKPSVGSGTHYMAIESPKGITILDQGFSTASSAMDPIRGAWSTVGPYSFTALDPETRIFFYTADTACTVLDDVSVVDTQAPEMTIRLLSTFIRNNDFQIITGSFQTGGVMRNPERQSVVVMKTNRGGQANFLDITSYRSPGGCTKLLGELKVAGPNRSAFDLFIDQRPWGGDVSPVIRVNSATTVLNFDLAEAVRNFRLTVRGTNGEELHLTAYLLCKETRSGARNPFEHIRIGGSSASQTLCLSMTLTNRGRGDEAGCTTNSCRMNVNSDATLQDCDAADWAQNFVYDSSRRLLRVSGPGKRCVTTMPGIGECQALTLQRCNESSDAQRFNPESVGNNILWRTANGFAIDTVTPSENGWVRACASKAAPRAAAMLEDAYFQESGSPTQLLTSVPTNFEDVVVVPSPPPPSPGPNAFAEAICPWYFNPPIHTGSNFIRCYLNGTSCNPTGNRSCCADFGGTFQCSRSAPFMCRNRDNRGDFTCEPSAELCEQRGGRRPCQGPPGLPGTPGRPGTSGRSGQDGFRGAPGAPGTAGNETLKASVLLDIEQLPANSTLGNMTVGKVTTLEAAKTETTWLSTGVTNTELAGACVLNAVVMAATFFALFRKLQQKQARSKTIGDQPAEMEMEADTYATEAYAADGSYAQYNEFEQA
jgi:hypothetical protein